VVILSQTPCGSSTDVLAHAAGRMSANPDSGSFERTYDGAGSAHGISRGI
jgi:hypothetical protein